MRLRFILHRCIRLLLSGLGFSSTENGGGVAMEVKLLTSFVEQLAIYREFEIFDLESLGRDAAESFVVDMTTILCSSPTSTVELLHVGKLIREHEDIRFLPQPNLKSEPANFLGEFFVEQLDRQVFWRDIEWSKVFQKTELLPGLDVIGRAFSWYLQFQHSELRDRDKAAKIQNSLLEIACRTIHDAIRGGAGIELETIGIFYPDLTFKPDELLLASLPSVTSSNSNDIKPIHWLRVGPRPELQNND